MEYVGTFNTTGNILICDPVYAPLDKPAVVPGTDIRLRQYLGVAPGAWHLARFPHDGHFAAALGRPTRRPKRMIKAGSVGVDSGTLVIAEEGTAPQLLLDGLEEIGKTGEYSLLNELGVMFATRFGDGYFPILVHNSEMPRYFEIGPPSWTNK